MLFLYVPEHAEYWQWASLLQLLHQQELLLSWNIFWIAFLNRPNCGLTKIIDFTADIKTDKNTLVPNIWMIPFGLRLYYSGFYDSGWNLYFQKSFQNGAHMMALLANQNSASLSVAIYAHHLNVFCEKAWLK